MLERFSEAARRAVAFAHEESQRMGHPHAGTEHLLLGLLVEEGTRAAELLSAAGAGLVATREKVVEAVGPTRSGPGERTLSARAQRALDRATRFSRQRGDKWVQPEDVLAGVLDVEGRAGQVLRGLGVDVAALDDAARGRRVPPPTRPEPAPADRTVPHCPHCHADLTDGLAHRAVISRAEDGEELDFMITFCPACGSLLGAMPF